MTRSRVKVKKYSISEKTEQAVIHESGEVVREVVRSVTKLADRTIQASLSSPYYSWAAVTLICAMGVRAKLWSHDTSNLVTGTGLTLLGASTVLEAIPILSGLSKTETMIDNQWDQHAISPWPIEIIDKEQPTESWLKNLANET